VTLAPALQGVSAVRTVGAVPDDTTSFLKSVDLFSDVSNRDLAGIAASMKRRDFRAGDAVVEEGEAGVGFFVVRSGTASVTLADRKVAELSPGSYFGEVALLADSKRTATIVADTDLSCLGMTAWDFKPMVRSHPEIALKLLERLAKQIAR
jgi:CRP/FNR family cyclic AMP-dependent transcriptional regulator